MLTKALFINDHPFVFNLNAPSISTTGFTPFKSRILTMYAVVWYIMPSFSIQNILVTERMIFPHCLLTCYLSTALEGWLYNVLH